MEDTKLKKILSDNLKLKLGHIRTLLAEQCIHPNYFKPMQAKCLLPALKTNTLIIRPWNSLDTHRFIWQPLIYLWRYSRVSIRLVTSRDPGDRIQGLQFLAVTKNI